MAADPSSGPPGVSPAPQITKTPSPRRLITDGIRNRSTRELSRGLQLDRSLLPFALSSAVSKGSVPLTSYLRATEPSIELLDAVISRGWDLNQRSADKGRARGRDC